MPDEMKYITPELRFSELSNAENDALTQGLQKGLEVISKVKEDRDMSEIYYPPDLQPISGLTAAEQDELSEYCRARLLSELEDGGGGLPGGWPFSAIVLPKAGCILEAAIAKTLEIIERRGDSV